MASFDRERLAQMDARDPLARFREAFELPRGVVYLDGNSLGPLPKAALRRATDVIEREWGQGLIQSWNDAGWFSLPQRLGDKLAPLVGAGPGEVVVTDTISVNLFKVLSTALALAPDRRRIVSERDNFPTDLYIVQGLTRLLGRGYELVHAASDEIEATLDADTAVLLLTHVDYRTGRMHDMQRLTRATHSAGALVVWDLAHSVGAVPVDLTAAAADFAVGCTYKYLNGGPGAPAFLYVAPRHQASAMQPLSGWWGHAAPFAFEPAYRPGAGVQRYLCGTQPILSMSALEPGLDLVLEAGIERLRATSLQLSDLFIALVEERCAGLGLEIVTPRAHAERGSQVSLAHAEAAGIMPALTRRGVIGDFRPPSILRFGLAPLYVRRVDVWDAVEHLREVLVREEWRGSDRGHTGS